MCPFALRCFLRLLFREQLFAQIPAAVRAPFLLPVVCATDKTTRKGAPRRASCSVRAVRDIKAGSFAGKCALAFLEVWQFLLRAALRASFGTLHFATFE